jgi:D-arabinose 1-dehydrogenase-like Zn-dependent alcohol dehydrogenase
VAEPEITGPSDVIVRVGGAGLCRTDLHIRDGWLAGAVPVDLPLTLGHETAGWVHAVGSAVEHVAVGDTVICHPNISCGTPESRSHRTCSRRQQLSHDSDAPPAGGGAQAWSRTRPHGGRSAR